MGENVFKFWNDGDPERIGDCCWSWTYLNKHFLSLCNHLNKKKRGAPRGMILKNRINHLITSAQAFGHKIPDLETSFQILRNQATKMMSFWKKLIIGNLVCIKTCYSFKPVKTPLMTKNASPKTVILWNHLWLMLWGMLTKNYPFFGNTFEP